MKYEGVDRGGGGGTGIRGRNRGWRGRESGIEGAESGVDGAGSGDRGAGYGAGSLERLGRGIDFFHRKFRKNGR